jgi:PTH1 family peptidyl-tRNA hydrolase
MATEKQEKVVEEDEEARTIPKPPKESTRNQRRKLRGQTATKVEDEGVKDSIAAITAPLPTPSPTPMPVQRVVPLLICSIGNPGSTYANTLHSAGHTVLSRLAKHLGYSAFQKERSLGNGLVSNPSAAAEGNGDWTLWQSTSYMNESGKGVRSAWTTWSRNIADGEGKLVVIYDELEKALGTVTLRTNQGASAKGHNGLKSIKSVIGNTPFARIGIGIGRPASRESDDVARYVLKKMTPAERERIEGSVDELIAKLKQVEKD